MAFNLFFPGRSVTADLAAVCFVQTEAEAKFWPWGLPAGEKPAPLPNLGEGDVRGFLKQAINIDLEAQQQQQQQQPAAAPTPAPSFSTPTLD